MPRVNILFLNPHLRRRAGDAHCLIEGGVLVRSCLFGSCLMFSIWAARHHLGTPRSTLTQTGDMNKAVPSLATGQFRTCDVRTGATKVSQCDQFVQVRVVLTSPMVHPAPSRKRRFPKDLAHPTSVVLGLLRPDCDPAYRSGKSANGCVTADGAAIGGRRRARWPGGFPGRSEGEKPSRVYRKIKCLPTIKA